MIETVQQVRFILLPRLGLFLDAANHGDESLVGRKRSIPAPSLPRINMETRGTSNGGARDEILLLID